MKVYLLYKYDEDKDYKTVLGVYKDLNKASDACMKHRFMTPMWHKSKQLSLEELENSPGWYDIFNWNNNFLSKYWHYVEEYEVIK